MISKDISRICRNYTKIENYEQAVEDTTQTWHCHHKRRKLSEETKAKIGETQRKLYKIKCEASFS